MAEKEESCHRTPAQGKKRSADVLEPAATVPLKKRRVTLTETSVISNAEWSLKTHSQKEDEEDDPLLCSHVAEDIHTYLRKMEVETKRRPAANYIEELQKVVTADMRENLVDWLVQVADEFKVGSDSLHLTVSYIDRFLSVNEVSQHQLKLLGVSAMLIAAKYEEVTHPVVEDFCDITDDIYTEEEILKMESDILKSLNFEMGNPTTKTFLRIVGYEQVCLGGLI